MDDALTLAYSGQQSGGDLPYFVGKQFGGGGWLKTLARIAFPVLRGLAGVAANTAEDVIMRDKAVLPALRDNALDKITNVVTQTPSSSINKRKRSGTSNNIFTKRPRKR